jgi:hypothetical protein
VDNPDRLPWEIVETFPSTDAALIADWEARLASADTAAKTAHALVGRALASYWAAAVGVADGTWEDLARGRADDVEEALRLARLGSSPDLLAEALLGVLYARWGPDRLDEREAIVDELASFRGEVSDEELRLRILEWIVLGHLDAGDLDSAGVHIEEFATESADTELVLFRRREILWRANVAMLEGGIDESLRANQDIISATANTAGSPFSFQNVAITVAIERFLRRGLADVVDSIRSIRASSPRVATNWEVGLTFALSEADQLAEAAERFEQLAAGDFSAVPRDLNWLVTTQLLALVALTLDDRDRIAVLLEQLRPFGDRDGTHGSGYASYGPVGRVVGALAARIGLQDEAESHFAFVLADRSAGPWTSLTRLDRARSRCETDAASALDDAIDAECELRAFGLDGWADEAAALATDLRLEGHGGPLARRVDGSWTFRHPSGVASLRDSTGARHLVELLARPGDAVDVTELDPALDRALPTRAGSESTVDNEAQVAYRRRLRELEQKGELTEGESEERSFLLRELAGSAYVVSSSSELERTRVRVTKAIRRTIAAIAEVSPGLGEHLTASVDTGRRCLYRPPDGLRWRVEREP